MCKKVTEYNVQMIYTFNKRKIEFQIITLVNNNKT